MVDAAPLYATKPHGRRRSFVDEVAEVAVELGTPFMPWQRRILEPALEFRVRERTPYYREAVVVTVPRQQGKTSLARAVMTWWARKWPGSHIVYSAQSRSEAAKRLIEYGEVLRSVDPAVKLTRGIGNERLRFPNGSHVEVIAPTETAGHGASTDLVMLDEAWTATVDLLQGLVPARAARPASMLWFLSTQGTEDSEILNTLCDKGRAGDSPEMAYFEWAADPDRGDDIHDPTHWPRWMPALGLTVSEASVKDAYGLLPAGEFMRAFGNRTTSVADELMPAEWWSQTFDPYKVPTSPASVTFAFDVNLAPSGAAIASAFPYPDPLGGEDLWHIDIAAYEPGESTLWIPPQLSKLLREKPLAIGTSAGSPARAVLPPIREQAETLVIPLRELTMQDLGAASGLFLDAIRDRRLTHGASVALDQAVEKARTKLTGDLWRLDRRASRVDVSPLMAAMVALYVGQEAAAKRRVPAIG
jgi:hypothetical protein